MKASWSGAEIVTRDGEPVSVILPIDQYEQLLKRAQDAEALARLKKSRGKPLPGSLYEFLARRRKPRPPEKS
jgi:hypothetical protein